MTAASLFLACGKNDSKKAPDPVPAPIVGKTELSATNRKILGSWKSDKLSFVLRDENGRRIGEMKMILTFAEGSVSSSGTCSFDKAKISIGPVSVTGAANISDDSIEVLEDKENTLMGPDPYSCTISIEKQKMNYLLDEGDTVQLLAESEVTPIVLHRQ